MTKQEFLDGEVFKMHTESMVSYKYLKGFVFDQIPDGYFKFDSTVDEVTDDSFTVIVSALGEVFSKEVKFKDLV